MTTSSAVVNDTLWTERYRPTSLDEMALEPENRNILQSYLTDGVIPHMLLIGPPGSGKTTVSRIIVKSLDCALLPLNASSERGIDTVRGKIRDFVGSVSKRRWNIVWLDEADALTSDAQTSLRNTIESYSERARFILTANYGHRIIAPIQSRCQTLSFGRPPLGERARILKKILASEGIKTTPANLIGYAERFPDLRQMLWAAQRGFLGSGGQELPPASEAGPIDGAELYQKLLAKNWQAFLGLAKSTDFDPLQLLRELFYAIDDDHARAGYLRHIVGKGAHECGFTPDPAVLFLATIAGAMDGL